MSARRAGMPVSASIVALRVVSPAVVELISAWRAAASLEVIVFEAEILPDRSVRVVKRRLISQSPRARSVSTVALALRAAAWVAQTSWPAGAAVDGAAATMPAPRKSSELPRTRLPNRAVSLVFIEVSPFPWRRLFAAAGAGVAAGEW